MLVVIQTKVLQFKTNQNENIQDPLLALDPVPDHRLNRTNLLVLLEGDHNPDRYLLPLNVDGEILVLVPSEARLPAKEVRTGHKLSMKGILQNLLVLIAAVPTTVLSV